MFSVVFFFIEIKKEVSSPVRESCPEPISVTNSFTGEFSICHAVAKPLFYRKKITFLLLKFCKNNSKASCSEFANERYTLNYISFLYQPSVIRRFQYKRGNIR